MSKTGDLLILLDELAECGRKLAGTAEAVRKYFSSEDAPKAGKAQSPEKAGAEAPAEDGSPSYSKEQVRKLLSAKAAADDGRHKAQVKELVKKYADGGSLKDIPEDRYPDLVAELEVIGNA
ncbi:MAG: hypothetical protein K6F35_12700 [Lachnospiraceae bacterium]|nr:hypothetical protein [Lachnospiraceae bacterium]